MSKREEKVREKERNKKRKKESKQKVRSLLLPSNFLSHTFRCRTKSLSSTYAYICNLETNQTYEQTDRQTGNKDKYNRQIKTISEHIFSSANLKSGAFDCQKSKVADK